ncbi:MAG: ATPase AAA [Sulfurovum sp. FS08-3]|nr:MAG: ATPase AAA [Sulfurovum sp. FS08-3]
MNDSMKLIANIINECSKVIVDKEFQIKLSLATFFGGGHILIEDIPGVGKTTLAKTLSHVLGLDYARVQFTSDLLPSDILGVNYYDTKEATFTFKRGPVFTQFLLADEINRASSKTQSALLEAMEERYVTIDGKSIALPYPFFVIATKNPFEEIGTYELPSSQLDRFAVSFSLGYPSAKAEREILKKAQKADIHTLQALTQDELESIFASYKTIYLSEDILDYIQEVLDFTRSSGLYKVGLSTRSALILVDIAKGWALVHGRDYVTPQDVSTVLPTVTYHRLSAIEGRKNAGEIADEILKNVHPDNPNRR